MNVPRPRPLVRLGLHVVRGLRREAGERIAAEAARRPFGSVTDLARRCRLRDDELAVLANVGAFASLGLTRRSALWQVSALDGRRPLLAQAMQPDATPSPLPEMSLEERYAADFTGAGLTTGRHPLALRRAELTRRGILSAADLARQPHGRRVCAGGAVIVRQRPGTARGMCFITLEDETGFANAVITPDRFAAMRGILTGHALLELHGAVQSRDGVVTLLVTACRPLFAHAPAPPSRDFH